MKPQTIILVAVLLLLQLCCGSLWARSTTAHDAEMVVTGWLKADPEPLETSLGRQVVTVETFTDDSARPVYYIVYLQPDGFVIVSADDLVEPIIGFADDGIYEPSPDNPLGALVTADLNGRIASVRSGVRAFTAVESEMGTDTQRKWRHFISLAEPPKDEFVLMGLSDEDIDDVRVAPFLQSKWSQSYVYQDTWPYLSRLCFNYYTPNNYVCGCGATAMAQLMRYHRYPTVGIGVHKFTIKVDGLGQDAYTRGGDGSGGPYSWGDMVLEPNYDTPESNRMAIGALCYDAGVAAQAEYNPSPPGTSTFLSEVRDALRATFKYENAVFGWNLGGNIERPELNCMVNPNLDANNPVILSIRRPEAGHAVVCDGYGYNSLTPYHHLNMAWSGTYDAWYNLPDVNCSDDRKYDTITGCIYNVFTSGRGEIISGRVTDTSGNPISGATVTAEGGGDPCTVITNNKGIYALVGVNSYSTYTLNVTKQGYNFAPVTPQPVTTGISLDSTSMSGNRWGINFVAMEPCYYDSFEDFERGDFSKFPWARSGSSNWTIQSQEKRAGAYSARAGWIDNDESTTLQVTVDCIEGDITFYWKVSSESGYDYLIFYIDGVKQAEWSGEQNWAQVSFPVTAGLREFGWTYSKDSSESESSDSAWIDDIVFPIRCSDRPLDAPILHSELEIMPGLGNTISWDAVPGAARYYAECANDVNFANIVADSGWIIGTSYTFTDMDPNRIYWYRVKAVPAQTWLQTSKLDFASDTMVNTVATSKGEVVLTDRANAYFLAGSGPANSQDEIQLSSDTAQLPAGWSQQWIGDESPPGSATYDAATDTWTLIGHGHDIWDNADDFHFVYQKISGSCMISARVPTLAGNSTHTWSKAGVMIRETLMDTSTHAMEVLTGGDGAGIAFQWRTSTGGGSDWSNSTQPVVSPPYWVRVVRTGDLFEGFHSPDGVTWTKEDDITIPMAKNVHIGLCLTSHESGVTRTATFDNVSIIAGGYSSAGTITSTQIDLPAASNCAWDVLDFNITTPIGTHLTVDILNALDGTIILSDVNPGADISGLDATSIKLRANLSTDDPNLTPSLHEWSVSYTRPSCESDWSNVVCSGCFRFPSTYSTYNDWVALGKPVCWCRPYQCDGDADNAPEEAGLYRVYTNDIVCLIENWKKAATDAGFNACCDFDHKADGALEYRVYVNDLNILVTNWKKTAADLPGDCPRPE